MGEADSRTRRWVTWVWIGLALIAVGALVAWWINSSGHVPATPSDGTAGENAPPPPPAAQPADFRKLVGRWVRTDTPYVIEIRDVSDDGTLQAAYYNPRPINVSRAVAKEKDGALAVFVELRDVGYPGSTYTLTHDRAKDLLRGVYFQAARQQSFDVAFVRLQR